MGGWKPHRQEWSSTKSSRPSFSPRTNKRASLAAARAVKDSFRNESEPTGEKDNTIDLSCAGCLKNPFKWCFDWITMIVVATLGLIVTGAFVWLMAKASHHTVIPP